jgi:hypothetical protein
MTILKTNNQHELDLQLFYKGAVAYADGKVRKQRENILQMCVTKEQLFKECVGNFKRNIKHIVTKVSK